VLNNVEPLVEGIAKNPPAASVLDPTTQLASSARNLFAQLKRAHEPVAPHEFLGALRSSFPQFAQRGEGGGWAQQDAEECLTQIMQVLSSKVKVDGRSVVEDLFGVEMDVEVKAPPPPAPLPPVLTGRVSSLFPY
jgi:ubiquitin carboxyl-terminal hydrolase 14